MFATNIFSSLLLLSAVAFPGMIVCQSPGPPQPPSQSAYDPIAPMTPTTGIQEIHVNGRCRILPEKTTGVGKNAKPRPRVDPVICHLESVVNTRHVEKTVLGNTTLRSVVYVAEQEYLLQNVTTAPVVFVVEHPVPEGWRVDSDPQPTEMVGPLAVYRVNAQPGQIVRLHVGVRHAKAMKPKIAKSSPGAPAAPSGF